MLTKTELKQWTDALRSGEYQQGQSYLKQNGDNGEPEYCCLGVLCELKGIPNKPSSVFNCYEYSDGLSSKTGVVPAVIANNFLGGSSSGELELLNMPRLDIWDSLAGANDAGVSFIEIADHLDKYYPAVEG